MMLTKDSLSAGLATSKFGKKLFVFESIDSTSACARTLAEAGTDDGAVVFAEFQQSGKGRQERTWESGPCENILFSTILRPTIAREQLGFLTFYAAVAVAHAVEQTCGVHVECKWPNDLLLNKKKFCGILLENSFTQNGLAFSVVGVGINVNQDEFPATLRGRATSLKIELKKPVNRVALFQEVMRSFEKWYDQAQRGQFDQVLAEWNARCSMFGKSVDVQHASTIISGTAIGLHVDGGLIVQTNREQKIFYAGDVTLTGHEH
jgi:BirA family biotin operon repressor/biotin-[acetyl-CoA-carboxylase] ligase